jgi:hypothetical protein
MLPCVYSDGAYACGVHAVLEYAREWIGTSTPSLILFP